ncbi:MULTISPECIES: DedA family protein [unclassified Brachybacterium]|uniref:DedA family protein n=1 Tax=unclassified Brachybacterium TaxID=2623841 RepID=UPI0036155776
MNFTEWSLRLMDFLGGPGLALVIAAEALFPPVPGEILLPFSGVSAAANGQSFLVPLFWTTLGSVVGGLGVYTVGRALGLARTQALVRRIPLMETKDVDVAMRFFERWGFPAVAIARFVPMVRTFISIPAGIEKMPVSLFALATGLGSGIWNAAFVIAGYFFGQAGGEALEAFVRIYSSILAGIGILALIGFIIQRVRGSRELADGEKTALDEDEDRAEEPADDEGEGRRRTQSENQPAAGADGTGGAAPFPAADPGSRADAERGSGAGTGADCENEVRADPGTGPDPDAGHRSGPGPGRVRPTLER